MNDQLTPYFERYAEHSIERMKRAVLAVGYYERIHARLLKNEDLSVELPIIKKVGAKGTMAVVNEALKDYRAEIEQAWQLHPKVAELGKVKIVQIVNEREHLPRIEMSFDFKCDSGVVKVLIKTAGETYKLEIDAGRNPMAAQLARTELEKNLALIALKN
jgi:hypothetical protein